MGFLGFMDLFEYGFFGYLGFMGFIRVQNDHNIIPKKYGFRPLINGRVIHQ